MRGKITKESRRGRPKRNRRRMLSHTFKRSSRDEAPPGSFESCD